MKSKSAFERLEGARFKCTTLPFCTLRRLNPLRAQEGVVSGSAGITVERVCSHGRDHRFAERIVGEYVDERSLQVRVRGQSCAEGLPTSGSAMKRASGCRVTGKRARRCSARSGTASDEARRGHAHLSSVLEADAGDVELGGPEEGAEPVEEGAEDHLRAVEARLALLCVLAVLRALRTGADPAVSEAVLDSLAHARSLSPPWPRSSKCCSS